MVAGAVIQPPTRHTVQLSFPLNHLNSGWLAFDNVMAGLAGPLAAVNSSVAPIQRRSYSLAGQRIAVRVSGDPDGSDNGLFFVYSDHLGSTSVLANSSNGLVSGSTARYHPFGAYRTTPTQTISDRQYTGHAHNDDLGLIYMNARYYVGSIGRFASADSIVPGADDPQLWNRYSFVLNNPLQYVDPMGQCSQVASINGNEETLMPNPQDSECWSLTHQIYGEFGSYGLQYAALIAYNLEQL
jgi:RHS repeat-associated protein